MSGPKALPFSDEDLDFDIGSPTNIQSKEDLKSKIGQLIRDTPTDNPVVREQKNESNAESAAPRSDSLPKNIEEEIDVLEGIRDVEDDDEVAVDIDILPSTPPSSNKRPRPSAAKESDDDDDADSESAEWEEAGRRRPAKKRKVVRKRGK